MKYIPNGISILRIFISIALIFLLRYPGLFLTGYFICGISDMADGYLARRYKWETRLGEQLDSLGDAAFYGVILYLLMACTDIVKAEWAVIGIAIVMVFRASNFIITRTKFKTWGGMHTWGNKAAGILSYLYVSDVLIRSTISFLPGLALCFIAFASSLEEMVILLTSKQYNANRKSLFIK